MIVNALKHNFLILGVTGPLRSGCSTAARFFSDNPQAFINKYSSCSEQTQIESTYCDISGMLSAPSPDDRIVKRKKHELNILLRNREIKKTLVAHSTPNFRYISMSTMLLKYVIEYILFNKTGRINAKYSGVVDIIRYVALEKRRIRAINLKIDKKRYRDISPQECQYFDDYLLNIDIIMTTLKTALRPDELGAILQDFGDNIRMHGNPFKSDGVVHSENVFLLSGQANRLIKYYRNRQDEQSKRKHHFVIECFRNPYEVEYFRFRYYEFYLLSIFAAEEIRGKRGFYSKERDKRDRGEAKKPHEIHMQDVSRCVYLSDIAINNEGTKEDLYEKLIQYYALIVNPGCVTPTYYEVFMNQAYTLSLKSSCISRQVGAVIIGKNGYVVGAGWNDAGEGQVGCGYRHIIDIKNLSDKEIPTNPISEESFRKYLSLRKNKDDCFCFKDEYSYYVLRKKFKSFMLKRKKAFDKLGTREEQQQMIEDWLSEDIKIKRLEYCRALHAEENALLQSAKIGGIGVKGGKIFTTSFPCELCAKKIYQAGIREVIYTEPYPESISQEVFLKDGVKRIKLVQFEGVKSHSYFRLYKASIDKKEMQELSKYEKQII